jgi:ArsR family transcriptional regulator
MQQVVQAAQSAVSRNLAILREAGFIRDRKEGTSAYFSIRTDMPPPVREIFTLLRSRAAEIPEAKKDQGRLAECRRRRLHRSQNYFESVAGDWERIRKNYFDDRVASLAIENLLPRNLTIADIGCGTGSLTFELARFAEKVVGVDLSSEMLRRARQIAINHSLHNVEFHLGDAADLPLASDSVDAAFGVMMLHFLPAPGRAVAELCRITKPGGSIVIVDLVQHDQEWMREQMAHRWLGFGRSTVEEWLAACGATGAQYALTGSYAGEKMARNGNRPVEIFVARANVAKTK